MPRLTTRLLAAAFAVVLIQPASSQASIIFTATRDSDNQLTLTASGTFDAPSAAQRGARVHLLSLFTGAQSGSAVLTNNTLTVTRAGVTPDAVLVNASATTGSFKLGSAFVNTLLLDFVTRNNAAGDIISGSVTLTLPTGFTFNPVGTTGNVWYGSNNSAGLLTFTGTTTIVAPAAALAPEPVPTPEPATLLVVAVLFTCVACAARLRRDRLASV